MSRTIYNSNTDTDGNSNADSNNESRLGSHPLSGLPSGCEILQLGYQYGFINDSTVWLLMLKKRNTSVHIYNEEQVDEMILLIRDSFIPAFIKLEETLKCKFDEVE